MEQVKENKIGLLHLGQDEQLTTMGQLDAKRALNRDGRVRGDLVQDRVTQALVGRCAQMGQVPDDKGGQQTAGNETSDPDQHATGKAGHRPAACPSGFPRPVQAADGGQKQERRHQKLVPAVERGVGGCLSHEVEEQPRYGRQQQRCAQERHKAQGRQQRCQVAQCLRVEELAQGVGQCRAPPGWAVGFQNLCRGPTKKRDKGPYCHQRPSQTQPQGQGAVGTVGTEQEQVQSQTGNGQASIDTAGHRQGQQRVIQRIALATVGLQRKQDQWSRQGGGVEPRAVGAQRQKVEQITDGDESR